MYQNKGLQLSGMKYLLPALTNVRCENTEENKIKLEDRM